MATFITHPVIAHDRFDYDKKPIFFETKDSKSAAEYLDLLLAPSMAKVQLRQINDKCKELGIAPIDDLSQIKTLRDNVTDGLKIGDWGIHCRFWEHADLKGDSFSLGVVHNTSKIALVQPLLVNWDWDDDLGNRGFGNGNNWKNQISSIESIWFAKYWTINDEPGFKGNWLIGEGDNKNLSANGWNDRAKSVVMCSVPRVVIHAALAALCAYFGVPSPV